MKNRKLSPKNLAVSSEIAPEARKSKFWKRFVELLAVPSRKRRGVNVSRLSSNAKEGAIVLVPDKVLGAGKCTKKLTVAAISFSATAKRAIEAAGGSVMRIADVSKEHPTGKDLIIIK